MARTRILAILMLGAVCAMTQQDAHARSMFSNIPGADLVRELSFNLMNTAGGIYDYAVGDIIDSSLGTLGSTFDLFGPHIEGFTDCLDEACQIKSNDPDAKRNVSQIIESRGFKAEEHDVTTRDGYILTIQRIINPLINENDRAKLKPVILQHGLLSSSVDWVINSVDVRPAPYPKTSSSNQNNDIIDKRSAEQEKTKATDNTIAGHQELLIGETQDHPNSLGFYLSNEGYDVYLANSRGNLYGSRHVKLSSWSPKFWDFTFDEQIKYDLPAVIEFVLNKTNQTKVGYVGHSQGTVMMFGLLSDVPEYADIVEPFVALAPVAYVDNSVSPVKYFAAYTPIFEHVNMWFGSSNAAIRYLAPKVCTPKVIRKEICANIIFLSCGFDEAQFNQSRVDAYLTHMPSGTSVKNIAHYGQEIISKRFAHFDHGILGNQIKYGQAHAPDYDLSKIRSKSIALFTAENDWLASPKDVARLKADLKVPLFKVVNVTESVPQWNHIDFVYGKDCGRYVNPEIIDIFNHFRN